MGGAEDGGALRVRRRTCESISIWRRRGPLSEEDRRGLTALFWLNINPYGTFRLDMDKRLSLPVSPIALGRREAWHCGPALLTRRHRWGGRDHRCCLKNASILASAGVTYWGWS
jgi:hypothetical protein